jgi:D-amino-acid dehydrogenase
MPRVVIAGGGVIGCLCAYYLVKAGWQATVLDRGVIGGACSQGNCGYVCPSHVLPLAAPGAIWATLKTMIAPNSPVKVRVWQAIKNFRWFLRFARRCNRSDMIDAAIGIQALLNSSRTLYDELLAVEKLDVEWDTHGLLFVFQSKKAFQHYAETDRLLSDQFGLPAQQWNADELLHHEPALKPGAASGGYLYRSDAQLRPNVLMSQLRNRLAESGVQFVENSTLVGVVNVNGKGTAAIASTGLFPADAFVIATGAWTPQLNNRLGCRIPILPGKGYSITVPRPTLCPKYPMIFEEHRVAVSPFRTGLRIGSTMEFAGYDESMNRNRLRILTDGAAMYLREPGTPHPSAVEWWGWRPMIPDGKPIIDRIPTMSNVLVAAGHGMLGLSMATGTGKLVAELLTDATPHIDPTPYRLGRFIRTG